MGAQKKKQKKGLTLSHLLQCGETYRYHRLSPNKLTGCKQTMLISLVITYMVKIGIVIINVHIGLFT